MSLAHIDNNLPATAPPPTPTGSLLAITSIDQAVTLAERICKTNFVPAAYRGKPEETLACILYGTELGLGPMQSLNSIDIVQGSVFLRAQLVQALARSIGGSIDVDEATPERAVVFARRPGWAAAKVVEFTWAEAQKQGLTNKDPWKKDPAGMLANRATTRAGRWYFADVLKGIYVEGEDIDPGQPASSTPAAKPVETTSIAELAEQRRAQLPGAVVRPTVPHLEESNVVDVQLPLAGGDGDDYLTWDRTRWANTCAGKLGLPEISRRFGIRNYDALVAAGAADKAAVYAALVEASTPKAPAAPAAADDDERPF